MAAPRVAIKVELDAKAAEDGFKRLERAGKSSFSEINSALEIAQKAFAAVGAVLSKAVGLAIDWAEAASKSEVAQTRLAAMAGTHLGALQKLNAEMLRKLGIDDDDSAALQIKLIALGVLPRDLERATKATIGLADVTGKDLTRASKDVARAFQTSGAEAARLEKLFAFSESTAGTLANTTKRLAVNWGELEETLGGAIIQSAALKNAMDAASEALSAFVDIFDSEAGRSAVDAFFRHVIGLVGSTLNAILKLRTGLRDLFSVPSGGAPGPVGQFMRRSGEAAAGVHASLVNAGIPDWMARIIANPKPGTVSAAERGATGTEVDPLQEFADRFMAISSRGAFVGPPEPLPVRPISDLNKRKGSALKGSAQDLGAFPAQEYFEKKEAGLARERELDRIMLDQTIAANDARFEAELSAYQVRQELRENELSGIAHIGDEMLTISAGIASQFVAGTIATLVSGQQTVGEFIKGFLGTLMIQMGEGLVAFGIAGIAAGLLGTVSPFLGAVLGGPAAIAAGAGLVIAGGALAGAGALLGGGGRGRARGAPGAGGSAGVPRLPSAETRGFTDRSMPEPKATVINISFAKGFISGTPRQIGRAISDAVRANETLRPDFGRR